MADRKMSWIGAIKKQGTERPRADSSPNNHSRGHGATGTRRRIPSSSLNGSASSTIDNSGFVSNGSNISLAPNQEFSINWSSLQQQTSIGRPAKKNYRKRTFSAVPSPWASATSVFDIDEARPTRDILPISRNGWNLSTALNQGLGNDAHSSLQENTPIGQPIKLNHRKNTSPATMGQRKKVGGAFSNSSSGGRNYPAHTGSGIYSHAVSCPSNVTSTSVTLVESQRNNLASTLNSTQVAQSHGFTLSNASNMPALYLYTFHQPPPTYTISYNIMLQNHCHPLNSHHEVSNTALSSGMAQQVLYSQPSQLRGYLYYTVPNAIQSSWNSNFTQYGESQQIYYQDPWVAPSNPLYQNMAIHPGNQYYPSDSTIYGAPAAASMFGANIYAGAVTYAEPLNHTSVWSPPQVPNLYGGDGSFTAQYTGAVDQPLNFSSYPENYVGEQLGLSYFTVDSLPSIPEIIVNFADTAPLEGSSSQETQEAGTMVSGKDEDLDANIKKMNKDSFEEENGCGETVNNSDNDELNGSSRDASKEIKLEVEVD